MKDSVFKIIGVVLIVAACLCLVDYYLIINNKNPIFVIEEMEKGNSPVTSYGLLYKVEAYYGVSYKEGYNNAYKINFGSWFKTYTIKR